MAERRKPQTVRAALIGLVGTVVGVCGGLVGAGISAAVTVYQVERQAQQVALAAPAGDQALTVDTHQIAISYEDALALDPEQYYVAAQPGFVISQPGDGWTGVEEMTYRDLFVERGTWAGSAWDEQLVYRIRFGDPAQVQYLEGTQVNGAPVDVEMMRAAYGSDATQAANEITVLALGRDAAPGHTLSGVALEWGITQRGGLNRIVANKGSDTILMQASWQARDVRVDGRDGDLSMERWALCAEGPQNYFVVEVVYFPQTGQPIRVWEDLQAYMDSFRVIR